MSIEITKRMNGHGAAKDKDTLFLWGGAAMIVCGAGMVLSTPLGRRYLGSSGIGSMILAAIPDIRRYMKIRAM
jgi:hypothetical protein